MGWPIPRPFLIAAPISTAIQNALNTKATKPTLGKLPVKVKQAGGVYPAVATLDRNLYYGLFVGPLDPFAAGVATPGEDAWDQTTVEV